MCECVRVREGKLKDRLVCQKPVHSGMFVRPFTPLVWGSRLAHLKASISLIFILESLQLCSLCNVLKVMIKITLSNLLHCLLPT